MDLAVSILDMRLPKVEREWYVRDAGFATDGMPQVDHDAMTQSRRKFLGVILTLLLIAVWCVIATSVYLLIPPGAPGLLLVLYFAIAGLAWMFPAGVIIKWMSKPEGQ